MNAVFVEGSKDADVSKRIRDLNSEPLGASRTEMTNINSQKAHWAQAMLLMPMMANNIIIVCDDTWYHPNEGVFIGKCSAVIPFPMLHGFELLHSNGYRQNSGAILCKFKK
jgi:hypothetical protein